MCTLYTFSFNPHHDLIDWVVNFFLFDRSRIRDLGQGMCPQSHSLNELKSTLKLVLFPSVILLPPACLLIHISPMN